MIHSKPKKSLSGYKELYLYIRSGYQWERAELLVAKRVWKHVRAEHKGLIPFKVLRGSSPPIQVSLAVNYALSKNIGSVAIGSLGAYPLTLHTFRRWKNL